MNILYATDGSEGSLEAVHFLNALATGQDTCLHILTIPASGLEDDQQIATATLSRIRTALSGFPGKVTTEIGLPGTTTREIGDQIMERITTLPADLLVVGTHGRPALTRWFIGSVATHIARHAPCPVLIAREPQGVIDHVLAGVDGSACSADAVRWTMNHLPLPEFCTVRLAGVVTIPVLTWGDPMASQIEVLLEEDQVRMKEAQSRLADEIRTLHRPVTTETRIGDATDALLDMACDWKADLLVVGSHGRSLVQRWMLGSVSEGVLQRSPCSVLIVREECQPESKAP